MIRWVEQRRDRARARRRDRDESQDAARREFWQDVEDETIEELSRGRRPLNELFEHGSPVRIESMLEYIAALERRVDRLEQVPRLADDLARMRRRL